MSERFCRGFTGVSHRHVPQGTVLEGDDASGARLRDVLQRIANLGLEVVEVDAPSTPADRKEH
ncbi:MAG: hypothetical protein AB7V42_04015 [Thermoleophilia bacterium]